MKNDPCWKGYEMIGTKKKNGKEVPNCVPKEEACCDDCADPIEEEAEHEGRKVTLNKPFGGDSKHKRYVYVKNEKGNVIKLGFGDPNMEIKRDDPERRKAYRARHNCDNPGPKWKANYWSCKYWSSTPTSKLDENDVVGFKSFLEGVERDKVDLAISKEVDRDKERHDRMRDQADRVDAASTKAQNRRLANEDIAVSIPMYVQEAAYDGNIGMMELAKFYMKASPADKQKLQDAIKNKRFKEAWKMVEKVTGVKLKGAEFATEDVTAEEVAANSVAGGGVDMNPTGKPKWDKRSKFHIDHMFRRADGTKYKKNKANE